MIANVLAVVVEEQITTTVTVVPNSTTKKKRKSHTKKKRSWVYLLLSEPIVGQSENHKGRFTSNKLVFNCILSNYQGMCKPNHPTSIPYQKSTTNLRAHFQNHHPDIFAAMEYADEQGEDPKRLVDTLLFDKVRTIKQASISSFMFNSSVDADGKLTLTWNS